MNIYHTVIVRKDLQMAPGLMAAQVAHISDQFLREEILFMLSANDNVSKVDVSITEAFGQNCIDWMKTPYLHVLGVNNKDELEIIHAKAEAAGLDVRVWNDLIYSDILKEPMPDVMVGISIGPCDLDKVKAVTGNLPLA